MPPCHPVSRNSPLPNIPCRTQNFRLRHQGFHGLLQYAGMTWTLEPELASAEDITGYWENASPIWEVRRWRGHLHACVEGRLN